jgi:hypothetical protein
MGISMGFDSGLNWDFADSELRVSFVTLYLVDSAMENHVLELDLDSLDSP